MSEENVELARQALEALTRRDRATWLALCAEDFEVVPIREWPEPGVRGAEAAWDFYLKVFDAFEQFPADDAEVVDAGGDKVLVHYRVDLSGVGSGAGVEFDYWNVVTIRQRRGLRNEWFADRAEALEAAGLRE
jgi:ketosteroid isomerase-like protein